MAACRGEGYWGGGGRAPSPYCGAHGASARRLPRAPPAPLAAGPNGGILLWPPAAGRGTGEGADAPPPRTAARAAQVPGAPPRLPRAKNKTGRPLAGAARSLSGWAVGYSAGPKPILKNLDVAEDCDSVSVTGSPAVATFTAEPGSST